MKQVTPNPAFDRSAKQRCCLVPVGARSTRTLRVTERQVVHRRPVAFIGQELPTVTRARDVRYRVLWRVDLGQLTDVFVVP
jgi:hypothetical protein